MKINLVLADDHPTVLAGIEYKLIGVPTLQVNGTAKNSTEIVGLLDRVLCDVLITDYAMPGGEYGDGMALLSFLRRRYPDVKIIVFSAISNRALLKELKRIKIQSFINKVNNLSHLISAIHAVFAGASYFPPNPHEEESKDVPRQRGNPEVPQLTMRETEIIRLYVSGLSINKIAIQLNRTKQTISSQKSHAMKKLFITRDAELYRYAYETGLVVAGESSSDGLRLEGDVAKGPRMVLSR